MILVFLFFLLLGGAYPDKSYRDKPNRVNVQFGGPVNICNVDDTANSYQLQIGSYCYVATEGGASCGVSYWGE